MNRPPKPVKYPNYSPVRPWQELIDAQEGLCASLYRTDRQLADDAPISVVSSAPVLDRKELEWRWEVTVQG